MKPSSAMDMWFGRKQLAARIGHTHLTHSYILSKDPPPQCQHFNLITISCNYLVLTPNSLHGVDPLSYFSSQPVLHDWCNKGRGMCYPVCGRVHIKEPLLLIDKTSLCGGSRFPWSLSEWSLTICLTPYNRR